jgi:hypothetical protein
MTSFCPRKVAPFFFFLILGFLLAATSVSAQSAEEVINTALEQRDAQLQNVTDVSVTRDVQPATGQARTETIYFVKRTVDGHAHLLQPETEETSSRVLGLNEDFGSAAQYEGVAPVDGHESYTLVIEDEEELEQLFEPRVRSTSASLTEVEDVTYRKAQVYIDTEEYVPRKVAVDLEVRREGRTVPVEWESVNTDYRKENGLLYPHTTITRVAGLTGGMTPEELEKARKSLQKLEQRLEEMPEARRKAAEAYMGDKLEKWRSILESGTLETVYTVGTLRINEGPPDER